MDLLSKEGILKAQDLRFEDVAVPEWGGTVRIKAMTARELDRYEIAKLPDLSGVSVQNVDFLETMKGRIGNVRATLVAHTAIDAEGKLLFSAEDVAALGEKNAGALDRLFQVAQRLNAIGEQAAGAIAKN